MSAARESSRVLASSALDSRNLTLQGSGNCKVKKSDMLEQGVPSVFQVGKCHFHALIFLLAFPLIYFRIDNPNLPTAGTGFGPDVRSDESLTSTSFICVDHLMITPSIALFKYKSQISPLVSINTFSTS